MPEQSVQIDLKDLNVLTDKVTVTDPSKQKQLNEAVQKAQSAAPTPTSMPTVTIKW